MIKLDRDCKSWIKDREGKKPRKSRALGGGVDGVRRLLYILIPTAGVGNPAREYELINQSISSITSLHI